MQLGARRTSYKVSREGAKEGDEAEVRQDRAIWRAIVRTCWIYMPPLRPFPFVLVGSRQTAWLTGLRFQKNC